MFELMNKMYDVIIYIGCIDFIVYVRGGSHSKCVINEIMGIIIEANRLTEEEIMPSRLLIYMRAIQAIREPKSVGRPLAEALLACKPNRRSMKLEQIFNNVLDTLPDGVVIKDIDVMFNPDYKVDVLKILMASRKRKRYSVIWPGRCEDGKLIYGEEGFPDYKTYNIENYDITCVIGGYGK